MSESELAIAGFYDHEQTDERDAPDWGGDDLFTGPGPRKRRFERAASRAHRSPPWPTALPRTAEPLPPQQAYMEPRRPPAAAP